MSCLICELLRKTRPLEETVVYSYALGAMAAVVFPDGTDMAVHCRETMCPVHVRMIKAEFEVVRAALQLESELS